MLRHIAVTAQDLKAPVLRIARFLQVAPYLVMAKLRAMDVPIIVDMVDAEKAPIRFPAAGTHTPICLDHRASVAISGVELVALPFVPVCVLPAVACSSFVCDLIGRHVRRALVSVVALIARSAHGVVRAGCATLHTQPCSPALRIALPVLRSMPLLSGLQERTVVRCLSAFPPLLGAPLLACITQDSASSRGMLAVHAQPCCLQPVFSFFAGLCHVHMISHFAYSMTDA